MKRRLEALRTQVNWYKFRPVTQEDMLELIKIIADLIDKVEEPAAEFQPIE